MRNNKDLIGMKIGRLTVLEKGKTHITKGGNYMTTYICKCDCGNIKTIKRTNLVSGNTKSCDCLHKEIIGDIGNNNKKINTYDLTGEYGIGYTLKGEEFYFDLEDYNIIKDYTWNISTGYVRSDSYKSKTCFHRLIMNCIDKNMDVDHINHNTIDNRKSNLRIVSRSQNQMNSIQRKNKTGAKGVSKNGKRWVASIQINKKRIYLGIFKNFDDAVKARKEAEEKYFGEYAYKEDKF